MYDNALMGILQNCGKLQSFLDAVFSFLARRTDFYILMKHEKAQMGFPPGVAESMVQQAFKKYEILTRKREAEIMREEETKKVERMSQPTPSSPADDSIKSEKKTATNDMEPDELPVVVPGNSPPTKAEEERAHTDKKEVTVKEKTEPKKEMVTADKKERAKAFNYTSDVYNGGDMKDYKWSQTATEVEIKVALSEQTIAKHVKVDIRSDHIKVEILHPEKKVVLDGKLIERVKVDDSIWNVDRETSILCINLEKSRELMWKSVLEGEEEIDLTKVDNTRNISEFDEEAQAAIQRASYDHHMKMQGLPSSSDKKAHEVLKKAWDAEGSPFKGTPFDPSRIQISGTWN